jgi:hypothetical protein
VKEGHAEIATLSQVECRGSCQWPLLLWVAPKSLSWMNLLLAWTLHPAAAFGSCC